MLYNGLCCACTGSPIVPIEASINCSCVFYLVINPVSFSLLFHPVPVSYSIQSTKRPSPLLAFHPVSILYGKSSHLGEMGAELSVLCPRFLFPSHPGYGVDRGLSQYPLPRWPAARFSPKSASLQTYSN